MSKGIGALAWVGAFSWLALVSAPAAEARHDRPVRNLPVTAGGYDSGNDADRSAGGSFPVCFDGEHSPLAVNNVEVLVWQQQTANQWLSRAHIRGPLVRIYQDHSGHSHMSVQIGATDHDAIEVIYNQDFGSLPDLQLGDEVESCGDYITSNAPAGPYPASPDGAILHWIHRSNSANHESGYIAIRGALYGY